MAPSPAYRTSIIAPLLNVNPLKSSEAPYHAAVAHFSAIPWCAALLNNSHISHSSFSSSQSFSNTAKLVPLLPSCRNPASPKQDQLFGSTLAQPNALPHMLCLMHAEDNAHIGDANRPIKKVTTLFALGNGLSGIPDVAHGGMAMAMLDEATGCVHDVNMTLGKHSRTFEQISVTAGMNVKFLAPVPTSGAVCATAWIDSVDGRKTKMHCIITDEKGVELVSGTSLWISLKPKM